MKLLIVIPAFNEAKCLVSVIENLKKVCPEEDFIVINDGSTDNTALICDKNGYPIVNLPVNLGLSGAFGTGMRYAFEKGYHAVLQFDADGQHRPEYIAKMKEKLMTGSDIVIGSRFAENKKPVSLRMLGSNLISSAIFLTTGKRIKDPTSGMRIYNRSMIEEYAKQINMEPEPDTISYLIKRGAVVDEIQVEMDQRIAGTSYLTAVKSMMYMAKMTLSILLVQHFRGGRTFNHEILLKEETAL